jgi:hypothetical protein
MPAGFDFAGESFSGTNGAVTAYVESLAAHAASRFGPNDPLAVFFRDERDGFFPGKFVFLDEILVNTDDRKRFLTLLDAATEQLLIEGAFTDYGREWVATVVTALRNRITAISS